MVVNNVAEQIQTEALLNRQLVYINDYNAANLEDWMCLVGSKAGILLIKFKWTINEECLFTSLLELCLSGRQYCVAIPI